MKRIIHQLEKNSKISDWRLVNIRKTGYQLYVLGNVLDNIRKISTNKYYLTVYCDHNGLRGSTDLTIYEHEINDLSKRLDQAVFIASRVGNPLYGLPGQMSYPYVETFDPTLLGDIEDILFVRLADKLISTVDNEKDISLSSSEFFLDVKNINLKNSRGIDLAYNTSEIFFDGVLLAKDDADEVEMHFEPRARRFQDLPVDEIVPKYAQYARDSLTAKLPASGRYPVVLSGNALSGIFAPIIHHTSAANQYNGTSQFKREKSIYSSGVKASEPLTLISNGYIPFGLRTVPADEDGLQATRFELVRDGVFVRPWSSQQFADYLNITPTGVIGNLEIPVGPTSIVDLCKDKGPVLQVVEFSALMPDLVSGNFAAEIKLGYEYKNGKVRPVKGGSVSGNLITGFETAGFSTESQFTNYSLSLHRFGTYVGPEAARFESFQVSGR